MSKQLFESFPVTKTMKRDIAKAARMDETDKSKYIRGLVEKDLIAKGLLKPRVKSSVSFVKEEIHGGDKPGKDHKKIEPLSDKEIQENLSEDVGRLIKIDKEFFND